MQLSWAIDRLALRSPLRISRGTTAVKDVVVVRLEHDGLVGHGEAAATNYYRQPLEVILGALVALRDELAGWADPFAALAWLDDLAVSRCDQPTVVAALDSAVS